MINLNRFKAANFTGVIHIGANSGQELTYYRDLGITDRLWIDPFQFVKDSEGCSIQAAIGKPKEFIYEASNNGESSSFLKPKEHIFKYPEIIFERKKIGDVVFLELDTLLDMCVHPNILVLDTQGMELEILSSCENLSNRIQYIVTEYYTEELYEGCGMLDEITTYLQPNYRLVAFEPEDGKGWGNAYFELINHDSSTKF